MKKIVISLGILLSGVPVLSVQAGNYAAIQTSEQKTSMIEKRMETMKRVCKLTPDQTPKVQNLLNDLETAQSANEKTNKGNAEALKKGREKNNYDYNQQLAKVLTPEQLKALADADAAYSKEHKAK